MRDIKPATSFPYFVVISARLSSDGTGEEAGTGIVTPENPVSLGGADGEVVHPESATSGIFIPAFAIS
jgi:hypothetical protein